MSIFDLDPNAGRKNSWKSNRRREEQLNRLTSVHFGTVGTLYLETLARDFEGTKRKVEAGLSHFAKIVGVAQDEPEWRMVRVFGLAYVALELARRANLVPWRKDLIENCALSAHRAACAALATPNERVQSFLRELKNLACAEDVIDLDAKERPSAAAVDNARVLRRRHEERGQILIAAAAFLALGDKWTREEALAVLGKPKIYCPPDNFPRQKAWQIVPVKGARRRYFYVFSRRLRKFEQPDD